MSTKTTLFYGIFADVIQLTITTKIHFDFTNIYNPLISELANYRSSTNLPNIPLEIWEQIKFELRRGLLIKLKVDFAISLACDCCKAGFCSDIEGHSKYSGHHYQHASLVPAHPYDITTPNRACCFELTEQHPETSLETVERWIYNKMFFTMAKLEQFLSTFELCLFNRTLLGTGDLRDSEYRFALIISAPQVLERDIANYSDRSEPLELPNSFTSLSTSALRNFDYDSVDLAFQRLREDYGIDGINFKESQPITPSSLIGPDEDLVPSWKLWFLPRG